MAGEPTSKTPMGGVKAFNCRSCGGQVNLLAPGQTLSAVCTHCGAVADLTDDNFKVISKYKDAMTRKPLIDIGTKVKFEGKDWQVVGYMLRMVREFDFYWEEYLLFNPYYGFRFLACAYGHWSWIKMVTDLPISEYKKTHFNYQGNAFRPLTQGKAEVMFVLGEFYWKVHLGDVAFTSDFVAPPFMLSMEAESGGVIWSLGQYVEPKIVADAVGLDIAQMPNRAGVGANQVNRHQQNLKRLTPIWLLSMVLTVALGLFFTARAPKQVALELNYPYPIVEDTLSKEFMIGGGIDNVEIEVAASNDFSNHWLEFGGILHNVTTNQNYELLIPVEFYEGNDDGHWTEGSKSASVVLNQVPEGKYELVSSVASDTTGMVNIKVWRGVPIYSNWIFVLILLTIFPVVLFIKSAGFEKKRNE